MTANAVEPEITTEPEETAENFVLPDMIDPAEAKRNGYIGRAYDEEPNLSTLVFKNEDGTNTLRAFGFPVKYVDENGKTRDISLKLKETENGDLVTADNNVITTFSKELSGGIDLEYEDISVRLVPEMADGQDIPVVLSEDSKTAVYTLDEQTALSYALTCTGFKEDIVVSEYTGQTDYEFTLFTSGLELWEQDGSYYLRDEAGEVKANIGDVIVFTADEKNNTMGSMSAETVSENEEYRLTIHVDGEYLASAETVYPIRIDPTIEIDEPGDGMQDTTIYSNNNNPFGSSVALQVGKRTDYGVARTLVRFSSEVFNYIHSSLNVNSASFEMYNTNFNTSAEVVVRCYMFEGEPWHQNTVTWNTANPNYISSYIDSKVVSLVEGYHQPTPYRYSFDVSKAVKRWVDARCDESYYRTTQSPVFNPTSFQMGKGLMFKALDESTVVYKTFSSSNSSTNKPSLTVNYTGGILRNSYYTKFDPIKYNSGSQVYPSVFQTIDSYSPQYRMNCYGYSMGFIMEDSFPVHLNSDGYITGYLHQPGDFSNNPLTNDSLASVIANVKKDAQTLGYSVTDYTSYSSTLPQFGSESRLIAVVYGGGFHFYVQHNDGTWSHKPGTWQVKNTYGLSSYPILTNENIKDKATFGAYSQLAFLLITKTGHLVNNTNREISLPCEKSENVFSGEDNIDVGDYFENANTLSYDSTSGSFLEYAMIDHYKDTDVFYIDQAANRQYTVKIQKLTGSTADINCTLYTAHGSKIASYDSSGNVYFSYSFSGGSQYYLSVYDGTTQEIPYDYVIEIF